MMTSKFKVATKSNVAKFDLVTVDVEVKRPLCVRISLPCRSA
jgi:hypothetical protein